MRAVVFGGALFASFALAACRGVPANQHAADLGDPLEEVRHERDWIDVAPAPIPPGLPLLGPEGVDEAGYPKKVVDRSALRSLLVNRRFTQLTEVLETFQTQFEADPRREERMHDAFDALGYPHARERELIDAWLAASPRSFAPRLASAQYWVRIGFLWRGGQFARDTSTKEFRFMEEAFEKARQESRKALELRPRVVEAQQLLINVEIAGGSRERASRAMEDALASCPSCYFVRDRWLWALEPRWGGSFSEMEKFAVGRADPRNPRHKHLLGLVELERARAANEMGKHEEQLAFLDKACAAGDEWLPIIQRADVKVSFPRLDQFVAEMNRADAVHPGLSDVLSRRAQVLAQLDRWEEAGQDLLYTLRSNPTSRYGIMVYPKVVQALDALGWKELQAGRSDVAARLYGLARALAPKDDGIAKRADMVKQGAGAKASGAPASGDARPVLTVKVMDGSGRPVSGARLAIDGGRVQGVWEQIDKMVTAANSGSMRTDESGRFRMPVGSGTRLVLAVFPGQPLRAAVVSVIIPITGAEVAIKLDGGERIAGKVVDRSGRPVAGVEVRAIPDVDQLREEKRSVAAAITRADGSFAVAGVDSGRYLLLAQGNGHKGPNLGIKAAAGQEGVVVRVDADRIFRDRIFRGRVLVARKGQAVVPANRFTVESDGMGKYPFSSADGRFSVSLHNAFAKKPVAFVVEGMPPTVKIFDLLRDDNDVGDVVVSAGRVIRGRVVDPTGSPVMYASVKVRGSQVTAWSHVDGSFEALVSEGPVDLLVEHERWLATTRTVKGEENGIEVRLQAGAKLKLLVLLPDGSPLSGANLRAFFGGKSAGCSTDPTGRCEIAGLEPGEYWIVPHGADGLEPGSIQPAAMYIRLRANEERGMRFLWSRERTRVSVRIVDEKGAPVPTGAHLFLNAPAFSEAMEADGTPKIPYQVAPADHPLENLAPGRYTVIALGPWGMPACALTRIDVQPGSEQTVTLRLGDGSCK